MIEVQKLKEAERVARLVMIVVLITAGTSKFFSNGGFVTYYSSLFQGDLRINLPAVLVDAYLRLIPFIEIGLGLLLLFSRTRMSSPLPWPLAFRYLARW